MGDVYSFTVNQHGVNERCRTTNIENYSTEPIECETMDYFVSSNVQQLQYLSLSMPACYWVI